MLQRIWEEQDTSQEECERDIAALQWVLDYVDSGELDRPIYPADA